MLITVLHEPGNETRVALSPAAVKSLIKAGFSVAIQHNAGFQAGFHDDAYRHAGAILEKKSALLKKTQVLLCINEPLRADLKKLPAGAVVIGSFDNNPKSDLFKIAQKNKLSLLSMNKIPRISRAQSMDSLSSQANLAGYQAVLTATAHYKRAIPMMMTAAGMIQPAKILVLGAGVAGLQAIATAKRLGAVIYAFDVRLAAKEQVESLGAEFIQVSEEDADSSSGYAKETSESYKKLQAQRIDEYASIVNIIICTALIPDKKAPLLIPKTTVDKMQAGSVIVDIATARGGNCELSVQDKVIDYKGITIVGFSNFASFIPTTASELYANNLVHLIQLLAPKPGEINFNAQDDIIAQSVLCKDGSYLPFQQ